MVTVVVVVIVIMIVMIVMMMVRRIAARGTVDPNLAIATSANTAHRLASLFRTLVGTTSATVPRSGLHALCHALTIGTLLAHHMHDVVFQIAIARHADHCLLVGDPLTGLELRE